jgi:enoyl-CoA hydratase
MCEEPVDVKVENGIALVTFRGRGNLNLLHREPILKLKRTIETLGGRPEVRVLVLRGHGERAFSAGVDVGEMKAFSPPDAESFIRGLHALMRTIMTLPQPVIASILGPCLGGAMELAMACDLRIAAEDAVFGLPEIRVAIPSVIEASLLTRIIGLGKARELILTGDLLDAREASRLGLVSRAVHRESLEEETFKMASGFLRLSHMALRVQKDILDKWLNLGEEQGAEYSIKAFALCFASRHPREGMEAFLEKREPVY